MSEKKKIAKCASTHHKSNEEMKEKKVRKKRKTKTVQSHNEDQIKDLRGKREGGWEKNVKTAQ